MVFRVFMGASRAEWYRRLRFFLISAAAYGLYLLVYGVLHRFWPTLLTTVVVTVATLSGDVLNYVGNRLWVFRAREDYVAKQGGRFFLVMFLTLGMQVGAFTLLERIQFFPVLFWLILLPFVRTVVNYLLHRAFTFRRARLS